MGQKSFVLTGHGGFHNRGCEALVRTTAAMLREQFPGCEVVLASYRAQKDRRRPAAEGLRIVDHLVRKWSPKWFSWKIRRVLSRPISGVKLLGRSFTAAILDADAVLQIGGDNLSSDSGREKNDHLLAPNEIALANGIPLVIWGASIGPFDSAGLEEAVLADLRAAALITVREGITEDYLADHGIVDNVVRVADSAMLLERTPVDLSPFWPQAERVLALNVSPRVGRSRKDGDIDFLRKLAQRVVEEVLRWDNWGVLLVPHVTGVKRNDDHRYMAPILEDVAAPGRVTLAPPDLDATQTKYAISQCNALMASRTHATIAGFSSGVPTISLAYSRKAYGINLDLFGHTEWLLDAVKMSDPAEAVLLMRRLKEDLDSVAAHLKQMRPEVVRKARAGVSELARVLENGVH